MQLVRRQWRFLLGAGASALLHVALVLLLARVRPAPQWNAPSQSPAIEVVLSEAPEKHVAPVVEKSAQKASPRIRARPPKSRPTAPQAVASARAPAAPASPAAPSVPETAGSPAWSDTWRASEGLAVAPPSATGKPGLGLVLNRPGDALGIAEAQPEALPHADPIAPESSQVAKQRIAGRIDGFVRAAKAYARAELTDVYWRNLKDKLENGFEVPFEIRDQRNSGSAMVKLADRHTRDAAAYGKSGNPFAGDPSGPGAPRSLGGDTLALGLEQRGISQATLATEMFMRQVGTASGSLLIARVLISQREDGKVADVALADSSGNVAYDTMALKKARLLLGDELKTLGPLPPEGRRSLWAFETDFHRMLPLAGCALDAYFVPRDCVLPLQAKARSRVRLEAIY